uniref:GLOBIN domain-containing protein n=1 Tax=Heterorhabditis bacteriophora TaxID=37862 RepID=A0A1I7XHX6_HETBA
MAVFKKLKKSKEKGAPLPEPEPVKQLDKRVGMETYSAAAKQSTPLPPPKGDIETPAAEAPTVDSRLPYPNFRELFTLKNYWKTVRRNDKDCGKMLLAKYLNQHPENKSLYAKLKNIDGATVDMSCSDPGFETVAATYLKVFDDVINAVEEKPGDVQSVQYAKLSISRNGGAIPPYDQGGLTRSV